MPRQPAASTATLAAALAATPLAAADDHTVTATGVVYHDRDNDGERDRGEPGIGGVRVSNGEDVVLTGPDGSYTIALDADDDILFVVKPSGWMTQLDERNKPQFHYIHRPDGSPDDDLLYPGIAPTGPLPDAIDFPLTPNAEPNRFQALFLGDPQPYDEQQVSYYAREIVNEIVETRGTNHDASFAVVLGDLVGDYLELYEPYNEANALMGVPVYNVYGNHDMNFKADNDADADDTFQRIFGPATYAFQHGPVTFIVLDNVKYLGFDGLRDDGFPRTGNYTGHLREDQLNFVRNLVDTIPNDQLIVVAMHIPLYDPETTQHSTPQHRELMAILSEHPNTLSLSAHTHRLWRKFLGPEQGYSARGTTYHMHVNAGATSGSWWRGPIGEDRLPFATMTDGTPNGYIIATFDGNTHDLRWKVAGEPLDHQMHFNLPDRMTSSEFAVFETIANVYMGDDQSDVRIRVLDHNGDQVLPWQPMRNVEGVDPVYADLYSRDQAEGLSPEGRSLRDPHPSSHIYAATLGAELPMGTYRVEARFDCRFGHTHRGSHVIRITD